MRPLWDGKVGLQGHPWKFRETIESNDFYIARIYKFLHSISNLYSVMGWNGYMVLLFFFCISLFLGRLWLGLTCLGWESNHYVLFFPWLGAITVFAMYWVEVWCSCLFALFYDHSLISLAPTEIVYYIYIYRQVHDTIVYHILILVYKYVD